VPRGWRGMPPPLGGGMPHFVKRTAVPAAMLLAILVGPALAGCSVQNLVHDASGGTVDVPGTSIPKDFPGNVPLVSGTVISAAGVGDATAKIWNVSVRVGGVTAIDDAKSALTKAGFDCKTLIATSDRGGSFVAAVEVKDDSGYIVNYTVTRGNGQ
jgi:hypothetical protein